MVLKTVHQRKAAIITLLFTIGVIFLLFFAGLRYVDPPEEYGVAINFGTSDVGFGEPQPNKSIKSNPEKTETPAPKEEVAKATPLVQEKVVTQTTEEAPVVEEKITPIKKEVAKPVKEIKKTAPKPEVKKPTPNKETQNALNNLFGNPSKGQEAKGEGDDAAGGVKGSQEGDPNSNKYYGNDGLGGEGNYLLKGRTALLKPTRIPDCNQEGIVVVRIEVDNNGKVINAVPGVKGTTNSSPCLFEPAKMAALETKWNPDGNAPPKQIGYISYKFTLSE
ncbi:energy transducer TonB [Wenyingzhuangia sp. 1_MG-2023]|nr:energy transducer TonB [Wenyingzhuangia sp. 1_MG-2023]